MLVKTPPGCHRQFHRAVGHRQLVAQAFRKAAHRELGRAVRGLAGRGDDAEDRGEVDDMRLAPQRKLRQERAGAVHHAPEIDVDQPLHLRLVDLVERAEQRDAGIVDDNVQRGVGGNGRVRKLLDLGGLADIDPVGRDLAGASLADLGGHLLQPGLVAVGERKIAAARGQLQRERATMPLAAPITAAALPDIAVVGAHAGRERRWVPQLSQIGTEHTALRALTSTTRQ
jgi:hypothetical protein